MTVRNSTSESASKVPNGAQFDANQAPSAAARFPGENIHDHEPLAMNDGPPQQSTAALPPESGTLPPPLQVQPPPQNPPSAIQGFPVTIDVAAGTVNETASFTLSDGFEQTEINLTEPEVDLSWQLLNAARAWLFSMVVHLVILVALGLLIFGANQARDLQLEMVFADTLGDQLIDNSIDLPAGDAEADELVITPLLPELIDDPLAAPLDLDVVLDTGSVATSEVVSPTIGIALTGRDEGMKQSLLSTYGGTALTEGAVTLGLEWLKKNQRPGGYWSLRGPYQHGAPIENRVAATAMAMLAFQGAGHTHQRGEHKKVVRGGMDYLLKQLDSNGNFFRDNNDHHRLYSQAQATIAICELYGMTKDESLRRAAQEAIDYAVKIQAAMGGWRYRPGNDTDTSVTGWFVMAFQSAEMAGLEVPQDVYTGISKYLDMVASYDGSRYAYHPGREFTEAMTAEALLCRQYMGWTREDGRLRDGVNYLRLHPINYRDENVYYWYYATQVMHHMEGDEWQEWNAVMREVVPEKQTKTGKEAGSWTPVNDRWGNQAGRLYTTCLSIYMLEVYYRHLPIYGLAKGVE